MPSPPQPQGGELFDVFAAVVLLVGRGGRRAADAIDCNGLRAVGRHEFDLEGSVRLLVVERGARLRYRMPVQRLWISLLSLGIGTGLITNLFLKAHSGQPRPFDTDLFGGKLQFMPAGSFNGACERNCSFVSGEASGAGWLICVLFVLPPRYRIWIAPPVILASVATAGLRVAVGAHYASDATLGLLLSITVFLGLLALEERIAER